MSAEDVAADLACRWRLTKRARSWGGDCPACSYHGAFAVKVGKGKQPHLYCSNGCTKEQLNDAARDALGQTWQPPPPSDLEKVALARAKKQAAALRLWSGSEPLQGTPAALYLASRGLPDLETSPVLRYRGDCWHAEKSSHPTMIARVQDALGQTIAVHRTYLTRTGVKAAVAPQKASLGPIWAGSVRLYEAGDHLLVGEGLETAASGGLLMNLPAWAAISAGNMAAAMVLPTFVRTVTIAADPDGPGRKAAQDAAVRWRAEGRTVRIAMPDKPGQDFNDLLQAGAHAGR